MEIILENTLDKLVGERFGYRLTIKMDPVKISEINRIRYKKSIENFDRESEKACSESIVLFLQLPQNWTDHTNSQRRNYLKNSNYPSKKLATIFLTLELWYR